MYILTSFNIASVISICVRNEHMYHVNQSASACACVCTSTFYLFINDHHVYQCAVYVHVHQHSDRHVVQHSQL